MAKRLLTRDVELWKPPAGRFDRASVRPEWDWFWADIGAVYAFDEGGGGRTRNLARNPTSGDLTWAVADGPWQPTPVGRGVFLDNSASGTDSIFTFDSPDPGIWHDLFTEATHIVVCTLDTNSGGGPYVLLEEGGAFTGLELHYRTSPETLHYYVEIENVDVEIDSTSTFSPDPSRLLVVAGRFDNGAMSLWINGIKEATGTADQSSFEAHSDEPGLGQKNGSTGVSGKEWGGKILAVYRSTVALTDDQMAQVGHDPFGSLRVRERRLYVRAPAGGIEKFGAATLSASGSVTASGFKEAFGAAVLSAAGSVSASGFKEAFGSAQIAASATLTATGTVEKFGAATLSATGSLAATGERETFGASQITASGTVTASGVAGKVGAATLSASATVAASGFTERFGSANPAAVGTVTVSGFKETFGSVTISGAGSVTATGTKETGGTEHFGAAALTATGAVSATGIRETFGASVLTATSTVSATAVKETFGAANLTADASLAVTGTRETFGSVTISALATVTASGTTEADVALFSALAASDPLRRWAAAEPSRRHAASDPLRRWAAKEV